MTTTRTHTTDDRPIPGHLLELCHDLETNPPAHLHHDELHHGDSLYMRRWYIHRSIGGNVRLHHIHRSDAERDLHDHPWDFTSQLLTGAYLEHYLDGTSQVFEAPCIIHRKATDAHRLELLDGPMWTLVVTGPWLRTWGFHTAAGWVPWREYHAAKGRSHPAGLVTEGYEAGRG